MTKINNQGFDLGCFFCCFVHGYGKPEKIGIFRRFGSMVATIKQYDIIKETSNLIRKR